MGSELEEYKDIMQQVRNNLEELSEKNFEKRKEDLKKSWYTHSKIYDEFNEWLPAFSDTRIRSFWEASEAQKKKDIYPKIQDFLPEAIYNFDNVRRLLNTLIPLRNEKVRSIYPVLLYTVLENYSSYNYESRYNRFKTVHEFIEDCISDEKLSNLNKLIKLLLPKSKLNYLPSMEYDDICLSSAKISRMFVSALIFGKFLLLDERCNVTLSFHIFNETTGLMNLLLEPEWLHIFQCSQEDLMNDKWKSEIRKVIRAHYPDDDEPIFKYRLAPFVIRCKAAKYAVETTDNLNLFENDDQIEFAVYNENMILDILFDKLSTTELKVFRDFYHLDFERYFNAKYLYRMEEEKIREYDERGLMEEDDDDDLDVDEAETEKENYNEYIEDDNDVFSSKRYFKSKLLKKFLDGYDGLEPEKSYDLRDQFKASIYPKGTANKNSRQREKLLYEYNRFVNSLKPLLLLDSDIFWVKRKPVDLELLHKDLQF